MKSRVFIWMICLGVIICTIICSKINTTEYIVKGHNNIKADRWNSIMAEAANSKSINLVVDGIEYSGAQTDIYMNEKMELMISADCVPKIFNCAKNFYGGRKLVIEKGNTKLSMIIDSDTIMVNDSEAKVTYSINENEEGLYIPVRMFKDYFKYSYEWNSEKNTATLVNGDESTRSIPYYYSYEDEGKSPALRSQGKYGTCWAFASLTALESTLRPECGDIFSIDHMVLRNSFGLGMDDGGDYIMSLAYLLSWQGPVLESSDPYDGKSEGKYKPVKHLQEVQIVDAKNYQVIKEMIYKYGGVQSSLYTSLVNSNSTSAYYNKQESAYCYIGENKPNHDVVIIGWDDNYPKENFNHEVENDGAFICRNSWGPEFGDNGNFYVSYYDSNIGVHNLVYTSIEEPDNYDRIYQTDMCGWVGNMGYKDNNSAYFANVYKAKGNEKLSAVGFYATDSDTEYEVYVCTDFKNADSLINMGPVLESGKLANRGYYTIKLRNQHEIKKDEKFAVIVKVVTPNSTKPIPIEFASEDRTSIVKIDDGEGYISLKGTNWENSEKKDNCNICLKAYTIK